MSELSDFEYFKKNQLHYVDFSKGYIDTIRNVKHFKTGKIYKQTRKNVGSINPDGYQRVWCNGSLRMKHRLLYWLYHGVIPKEIDHIDRDRNNNSISNLREVSRSENNTNCGSRRNRFKFTEDSIRKVCNLLATTNLSDQAIADQIGCSRVAVREIKIRENHIEIGKQYQWNHRGY